MLDLSDRVKRYFDVKIGSTTLSLKPPKLKYLKKIEAADSATTIQELEEIVVLILSHNKTGKKIDVDFVEEHMDQDDITILFEAYSEWISGIQNDPN